MTALGGTRYLAELAAMARECLDPMKWAAALHALAFRRNLISVAREIQEAAQSAAIEYDAEKIADFAERMMAEATAGSSPAASERFRAIGDLAGEVVREVTGPKGAPAVMFGLKGLDELTGGLPREGVDHRGRPARHGQDGICGTPWDDGGATGSCGGVLFDGDVGAGGDVAPDRGGGVRERQGRCPTRRRARAF